MTSSVSSANETYEALIKRYQEAESQLKEFELTIGTTISDLDRTTPIIAKAGSELLIASNDDDIQTFVEKQSKSLEEISNKVQQLAAQALEAFGLKHDLSTEIEALQAARIDNAGFTKIAKHSLALAKQLESIYDLDMKNLVALQQAFDTLCFLYAKVSEKVQHCSLHPIKRLGQIIEDVRTRKDPVANYWPHRAYRWINHYTQYFVSSTADDGKKDQT